MLYLVVHEVHELAADPVKRSSCLLNRFRDGRTNREASPTTHLRLENRAVCNGFLHLTSSRMTSPERSRLIGSRSTLRCRALMRPLQARRPRCTPSSQTREDVHSHGTPSAYACPNVSTRATQQIRQSIPTPGRMRAPGEAEARVRGGPRSHRSAGEESRARASRDWLAVVEQCATRVSLESCRLSMAAGFSPRRRLAVRSLGASPWDLGWRCWKKPCRTATGRLVTTSLAEYVVAVNADVRDVDVESHMRAEEVILVTGATGNTGSALLQQLEGRGARVRAMVRRQPDRGRLRGTSATIVAGDFHDPRSLEAALAGVARVPGDTV
jgi:hypothetical protein